MTVTDLNWDEFEAEWRRRHDSQVLQRLGKLLDRVLIERADRAEYDLLWRAARLAHFRAMQAEAAGLSDRDIEQLFTAGAEHALRAVDLNRLGVEGHFWYGATL